MANKPNRLAERHANMTSWEIVDALLKEKSEDLKEFKNWVRTSGIDFKQLSILDEQEAAMLAKDVEVKIWIWEQTKKGERHECSNSEKNP